ncbi:MAG: flippase-like domain-containing protein [Oscillospiraceae bacterium]|nr:flippase-like domain-containing protein [Oscillospiraceae bacterium]
MKTSRWYRWIGSILFPVASLALLVVLGFTAEDVHLAWNALLRVSPRYLAAAACCWCLYVGIRALALVVFCRFQGCSLKYGGALYVTFIGLFYSGITPAATGGQPMQVYELTKRGAHASVGTSAVAVETAGFQFLLVILATCFWLACQGTISATISVAKWVLIGGFALNLVWTVFLAIVLAKGAWIARPVEWTLRMLGRARLLRNPEHRVDRFREYVAEYEAISDQMFKRPTLMILCALMSGAQVLAYMSMVYFIYRGFGWSAAPYGVVTGIQMLLYLVASMVPTPGATGAQEGSFYVFLGKVFPESSVFPAMLVWRFFTYYLMLIAGAATLLAGMVRMRGRRAASTD